MINEAMNDDMNKTEKTELQTLREELRKDMQLQIANLKIWLLLAVIINVVPALFVYFNTDARSSSALTIALDNKSRLDNRSEFISYSNERLGSIERHLERTDGYKPVDEPEPMYE